MTIQEYKRIRFFDVIVSLTGLIILSPILITIYLIIYLSGGAPIFSQERVGQFENKFKIYKFRTMEIGTPSVATHFSDESKITLIGRGLRKVKLDELPQLWNVIRGEMSLVGPRPSLVNQNKLIRERRLHNLYCFKPGITGLAQIKNIDMSTPKKLAIEDAKMMNNLKLSSYFFILFKTAVFIRSSK